MLEALAGAPEADLVAVVTVPPRPAGRRAELTPTPVAQRATLLGVPILAPVRLRPPEALAALEGMAPALGIVADYGKILPPVVLDRFPRGVLGVHPSLLPRHRGAAPVPAAILAGDAETGVSLYRMDAGMDTGPLIAVERVALGDDEDAPALEARLAAIAATLLGREIGGWLAGTTVARPQPSDGATVTRPLSRDDGRLDPDRPVAELERLVRAMRPWPGTWLDAPGGRLAVLAAAVAPPRPGDHAGTLVEDDGGVALAASDGRLRLLVVQPAGGRPMDGRAFLRGRPGIAGSAVG